MRDHKRPGPAKRFRKAAWALAVTVVAAVVTNSLTGVFTSGFRNVWERVAGGEPLVVHSALIHSVCGNWVIPGARPTAHPEPPPLEAQKSQESLQAWLRSSNAVDLGDSTVELTIRGRSGTAVVLQGMRVRIVERRKPVSGAQISKQCGSAVPLRLYRVDLDIDNPLAKPQSKAGPVVPFPYKVTHGDPEVILVTAETRACDCSWDLELVYVDGADEHVKVIDDHGRPFRTTGPIKGQTPEEEEN